MSIHSKIENRTCLTMDATDLALYSTLRVLLGSLHFFLKVFSSISLYKMGQLGVFNNFGLTDLQVSKL